MRRRVKESENADIYQLKRELPGKPETLSRHDRIDLYYADQAAVSLKPNVPYAWQFPDERAAMPSAKGSRTNCFALLATDNRTVIRSTRKSLTANFILEQFEGFSINLKKLTVIVLDNAPVHRARIIKERIAVWQKRGLFLFYLPGYSPHLNIVETLWRKLKYE